MGNPYPRPEATPLEVIRAEIDWLLERVVQLQRQQNATERLIAVTETRIQDLRHHLARLEREEI